MNKRALWITLHDAELLRDAINFWESHIKVKEPTDYGDHFTARRYVQRRIIEMRAKLVAVINALTDATDR